MKVYKTVYLVKEGQFALALMAFYICILMVQLLAGGLNRYFAFLFNVLLMAIFFLAISLSVIESKEVEIGHTKKEGGR